jgi:hypothetical protein
MGVPLGCYSGTIKQSANTVAAETHAADALWQATAAGAAYCIAGARLAALRRHQTEPKEACWATFGWLTVKPYSEEHSFSGPEFLIASLFRPGLPPALSGDLPTVSTCGHCPPPTATPAAILAAKAVSCSATMDRGWHHLLLCACGERKVLHDNINVWIALWLAKVKC